MDGRWLESNDFQNMTFFGQDWGGLIGLRMITNTAHRFDRVVVSNTGLPITRIPADVIAEVEDFRANKPTPTLPQMMKVSFRRGPAIASHIGKSSVGKPPMFPPVYAVDDGGQT